MLSLKPAQKYSPPSKWQYRLTRFMFTRVYWGLTRIFLPLLFVLAIGYQIWVSDGVRSLASDVGKGVHERLARIPFFIIDEIRFQNATDLREEEVRALLDVEPGMSILDIDRSLLLDNLMNLDAVGSAQIRFSYNGIMEIVLEPRIPAMIYLKEGEYFSIDEKGHRVEGLSSRDDRPGLFVISGKGADTKAAEAYLLIQNLTPLAARVRGLVLVGERRWDIVLSSDLTIKLPAKDPLLALQVVLQQHKLNDILNRNIEIYDLRDPERPIIRLHTAAQAELERLKSEGKGSEA